MTTARPQLQDLGLNTGKKARLYRMLFQHGLRNGTALFLPYDQGLEHGPREFHANSRSSDPAYVARLALKGEFNGIVVQIGLAEKFYWDFAGEVPLILKLNGRTGILSPLHGTVSDAVRLGADAVGYTLSVGSALGKDIEQYRRVRDEARYYGMPLVVWVDPGGFALENGGEDSVGAVDYAARVASELGADVVTLGFPRLGAYAGVGSRNGSAVSSSQAMEAVVRSATRTLVLMAGGDRAADGVMCDRVRESMDAGATGLLFGREVWERSYDDSMRFIDELKAVLAKYPSS